MIINLLLCFVATADLDVFIHTQFSHWTVFISHCRNKCLLSAVRSAQRPKMQGPVSHQCLLLGDPPHRSTHLSPVPTAPGPSTQEHPSPDSTFCTGTLHTGATTSYQCILHGDFCVVTLSAFCLGTLPWQACWHPSFLWISPAQLLQADRARHHYPTSPWRFLLLFLSLKYHKRAL